MLAACLAVVVALGAEAPKTKPKNIDISLSARWAPTPLAVEAAEVVADEGGPQFWRFAESMADPALVSEAVRTGGGSERDQMQAVEEVAGRVLSPLGVRLLRVLVSAHVLSPRVEMWRQVPPLRPWPRVASASLSPPPSPRSSPQQKRSSTR